MKKRFLPTVILLFILTTFFCSCANNSTPSSNSDTISSDAFEIPDVTSLETEEPESQSERNAENPPSLYEKHSDYFKIGVALGANQLDDPDYTNVALKHFNSLTAENEMKPGYVLDSKNSAEPEKYNLEPAIKFNNIDKIMKFAQENGLQVRYHTLVWHSQTPRWFFTENYSTDSEAPYVSREVMLARMESYIKQVLEYCDENYPGIIYAVDVVNEAIEHGDNRSDGIRVTYDDGKDNPWFYTVGPDYVEQAFIFARKYAPSYMKLFYNDYGCHSPTKRLHIINMLKPLAEQGLIDGMGFQSHYGIGDPTTIDLQLSIEKYAELGIELQVTELDIDTGDKSEDGQLKLAVRYKKLMNLYKYIIDQELADITSVTVWGLTDNQSWLNKPNSPKYPLLFSKDFKPKEAFWGFYQDDSIPNY